MSFCPSLFHSCSFFPSLHPLAHRKFELVWINPDITNRGFWNMILFIVVVWFTEIKFKYNVTTALNFTIALQLEKQ